MKVYVLMYLKVGSVGDDNLSVQGVYSTLEKAQTVANDWVSSRWGYWGSTHCGARIIEFEVDAELMF